MIVACPGPNRRRREPIVRTPVASRPGIERHGRAPPCPATDPRGMYHGPAQKLTPEQFARLGR